MIDISTTYMGLKLANPLIVGASGLTGTPEGIQKAAEAGAGAIVLKSLFEEQILTELGAEEKGIDLDAYPEAEAFISRTAWEKGTENYLEMLNEAKARAAGVPIFASINCVGSGTWASFASRIEKTGADGLELNIAFLPATTSLGSKDIEAKVLSTVREARRATKLPIQVKLGQHYSSLPNLAQALSKEGANALVLFNRFYRLDIDLKGMKLTRAQPLSGPDEYHESLRWVALLFQRAGLELTGATGIHDAETVTKFILAGAGAVQICSAIYKGGWKVIGSMVEDLGNILDSMGFSSLDAMRGKLSAQNSGKPADYLRLQYIKALTGIY
ncbi:MAG: dihydroorotate dehydrogenase-like protein [Spirochaetes bacterium]|nr:dihydroorotate dehydrogenase-like protein [Spirochaetota bacterium]